MCHRDNTVSLGFCAERYAAGTHVCLVYREERERRRIISRFVESGLLEKEQVFYFADIADMPDVDSWLHELDIDARACAQSGGLHLGKAVDTYCPEGKFEPLQMTYTLKNTYEVSQAAGYSHSRVSGEMSWALHELPGSERLIEYEAMVNDVVKTHPITAMCQYDANRFDGDTIFRALQIHPYMVMGGQIVRNPYYGT